MLGEPATGGAGRAQLTKEPSVERGPVVGQYWKRFRVFFMVFRFLGNMPYKMNPDGEHLSQSLPVSLYAVGAAVVQVVALHLAVNVRKDNPRFWSNYQNIIDSLVRLFISSSSLHFLASWWQMSRIIQFVNTWQDYTVQFEYITGTSLTVFRPSLTAWALLLSALTCLPTVALDLIFLQPQFELWFLIPQMISRFYTLVLIIFWTSNCVFIIQTARNLRKSFVQAELVDSYRLLWLGLRHRVADLGSSFSGVLILLLLTSAMGFVLCSYNMLSVLAEGKYSRIKKFLAPWIWSWLNICLLCFFGHKVTLEIGKYFPSSILDKKLLSLQPRVREQVESVLDTVEACLTDVLLAGCIPLNRRLLLRGFIMTIFYLAILLQTSTQYVKDKVNDRSVVPFYW